MAFKNQQLEDLLVSCFSPSELRDWLGQQEDVSLEAVSWVLPAQPLAQAVVEYLERCGAIRESLFQSLAEARPGRRDDIDAVRRAWLFESNQRVHPLLEPHLQLSLNVSRLIPAPPERVYRTMRDRMLEICVGLPHVLTVEAQYTRVVSTGPWSGHLFRFGPGQNQVLGPILRSNMLLDWVDVLMTACQHAVWDDVGVRSFWGWEHLYFDARQIYEFLPNGAETEVRCAALYNFYPDRITQGLLLRTARGTLEDVQPALTSFLSGCITDYLDSTAALLARE
jgi:hypothetical protein